MANSVSDFSASESFLTQGLEAGGAGCIAAVLNVNAVAISAVFDGRIAGEDVSEADAPINREKPTTRSFPTLGYIGKSPEWPFEFFLCPGSSPNN